MSTERTITIAQKDLPTDTFVLKQKGRGTNKYTEWTCRDERQEDANGDFDGWATTLTETEVCEFSTKALKELTHAEEALQRAQDRADTLREFSKRMYAPTIAPVTLHPVEATNS
jgi:hypothetical protein